jgi:hypothetical protein
VEQVRVDPAALRQAADELTRLAGVVAGSRGAGEAQVTAALPRLGELQGSVLDQWRAAGPALDRVEADFREIGRALSELAGYFADLDRGAVGR